jgi:hypothetical protein
MSNLNKSGAFALLFVSEGFTSKVDGWSLAASNVAVMVTASCPINRLTDVRRSTGEGKLMINVPFTAGVG